MEFAANRIRLQVLESRETVVEVCSTENNRMWAPFSPNHISGPDTREVATEEGILGIWVDFGKIERFDEKLKLSRDLGVG